MSDSSNCAPCETRLHQTSIRETTLDGQRAIVTGANSGIGEAIAKGLAEAGAAVVVNYVSGDDKAEKVVAEIREAGGNGARCGAEVRAFRREKRGCAKERGRCRRAVRVGGYRPHRTPLENLIENALNHATSAVTIEVLASNGQVRAKVVDDGRGIAKEDLHLIFERFYRGEKSRKTAGAGLGLAITKRIVELHGGKIGVDSGAGAGTCFSFELPVAHPH